MKKRIISLVLTAMVTATILMGCSTKSGDSTAAKGDGAPIKIVFWHGMGGNLGTALDKLVKDFNDTHKDIQVVAQYQGAYDDELNKLKSAQVSNSAPDVINLNQKQITDLGKGAVGGVGDEGLKKLANKLPSHIPYYSNRVGVRSGRYLVIPIESIKRIKGTTALVVIGLGSTAKSVWDNYHSGYSFREATGRTSIDVSAAIFSIRAGAYTGGVGGIVAGTFLSGTGEVIKNEIWGKS